MDDYDQTFCNNNNDRMSDIQEEIAAIKEQLRRAEARLAMATEFHLPGGWWVMCRKELPADRQWGLFHGVQWHSSYPTREEAFAAWERLTQEEADRA